MPIEIIIPRLGWSMEEGNFVNWLKKDGEPVKSGEPLFSLENEKAVQEVEAVDSGLLRIPTDGPKPGQVVKVGQVIGYLLAENESLEAESTPPVEMEAAQEIKPEADAEFVSKSSVSPDAGNPPPATKPAISPRARRLAEQLGVDATRLRGTGPEGRITEKDVQEAAK
jgi:pyruvate dehydrogenase E2 component (dihydrolipoamide acetyltransferase)